MVIVLLYTDESKLQFSMNRFFSRMPVDNPVTRTNYSFQAVAHPDTADPFDPKELSWAKTMKGDEEDENNKPGYLNAQDDSETPWSGGVNGKFNFATGPLFALVRAERSFHAYAQSY